MLANKIDDQFSPTSKMSDHAFEGFCILIYEQAGISMSPSKRSLVEGRLAIRLRQLDIPSYEKYLKFINENRDKSEIQVVVDLLTTNETYFFRENQHFDFLTSTILPKVSLSQPFSIWSAASSTGQEAYTIAMVLAEKLKLHGSWKILGTDINTKVIAEARLGRYQLDEKNVIPVDLMKKYCLKGIRDQEGYVMFDRKVKEHMVFEQLNLIQDWPRSISDFDVAFLRNVMIYFDESTKKKLVNKIIDRIKPGGYFFIGHSESLHGMTDRVKLIKPSIYMKHTE